MRATATPSASTTSEPSNGERPAGVVEDQTLAADAAELHHALGELIRVYQFRDRDRICCYDVSVTQAHALGEIVEGDAVTVNDLAAALYLDKSTASRVIAALDRKGYVRRASHPDDQRAVLIRSTQAGRMLFERIRSDVLREEQRLLADFDPEIRQAMTRLISRLARAAAARVDTTGGRCCSVC